MTVKPCSFVLFCIQVTSTATTPNLVSPVPVGRLCVTHNTREPFPDFWSGAGLPAIEEASCREAVAEARRAETIRLAQDAPAGTAPEGQAEGGQAPPSA